MNRLHPPRGNSVRDPQLAADNVDGVHKGQAVRADICFQRGFVHQSTDGEVGHHESVELLAHQIGCLAPQHDLGAAQMGL